MVCSLSAEIRQTENSSPASRGRIALSPRGTHGRDPSPGGAGTPPAELPPKFQLVGTSRRHEVGSLRGGRGSAGKPAGLSDDAPLTTMVVEVHREPEFEEPLGKELGHARVLRTSVLVR